MRRARGTQSTAQGGLMGSIMPELTGRDEPRREQSPAHESNAVRAPAESVIRLRRCFESGVVLKMAI
jgi:hypothetical protein